jgi:hypothetical protein
MCSIQEAWGNFQPNTENKVSNLVKNTKQQQLQIQTERGQVTPGGNPPDVVGGVVMQDDDHRQYARATKDYNYPDFQQFWNKKTDASMNGMTRGVHNKYSRDKRIDFKQHNTHMGTLETDVDMKHYLQPEEERTGYLDIYDKPSPNIPGLGPLARLQPMAANIDEENYMDVSNNYYGKELQKPGDNSFTPEVITNHKLMIETEDTSSKLQSNTKDVIPDEIRRLQEEIKHLVSKIEVLETKVKNVENNSNHDIILFVVISIFILFVIDNVFKFNRLS